MVDVQKMAMSPVAKMLDYPSLYGWLIRPAALVEAVEANRVSIKRAIAYYTTSFLVGTLILLALHAAPMLDGLQSPESVLREVKGDTSLPGFAYIVLAARLCIFVFAVMPVHLLRLRSFNPETHFGQAAALYLIYCAWALPFDALASMEAAAPVVVPIELWALLAWVHAQAKLYRTSWIQVIFSHLLFWLILAFAVWILAPDFFS